MKAVPKQETFDRIVAHLRKQGCRSISGELAYATQGDAE